MLPRSSRHFRLDLRASRRAGATVAAFAGLLGASTQVSRADTFIWNNTGTDFNTAADWTPTTGYPGSVSTADVAQFTGAAVTNPNLSASDTIASVNFSDASTNGYTLSSSNGSALTLLSTTTTGAATAINSANTTGTNTISAPLIFGGAGGTMQTIQAAPGGTLSLTGSLSNLNANTLQIGNSGLGTVSLAGTSGGLSAAVKLNGGTLVLGNDTSLGSGTFAMGTTSTVMSADTNTRTINNALGSFGGSNPTYTFGTAATGDLIFSNTASASISGANARNFTVNNANTTITAALTASSGGGLKKLGTGNLILLGANTYGGAATVYSPGTTITAGTLIIGNGTGGANLPGTTSLNNSAALVFNTGSADASTTTGSATGAGSITKNGAGSVTLNSPTYNAGTTSGSATVTVSTTGGLLVGATVTGAGIAAGTTITTIGTTTGSVTTVTLSNAATATAGAASLSFGSNYTGAITVNGGTLSLGGVGAAISGSATITLANGTTIGFSNPDQTFLNRINNSGTTSSNVTAVVGLGTGFAGAATLNFANLPNATLGATSNVTLSSGTITPANNLYRLGGGTGALTVNGALITGASNNLEINGSVIVGTNPFAYGGTTAINSGGRLRLAANDRLPSSTALTVNSGGVLDIGNVDLTKAPITTVASLAGGGTVTNSSSSTASPNKTLVVNSGAGVNTTFSGVIEDSSGSGVANGATIALTKSGTGSLNLTGGANTYSGATTINGGTLFANNATGSATGTSAVGVSGASGTAFGVLGGGAGLTNGGTLSALTGGATSRNYAPGILGVISGTVTVNNFGHLAPGNSVGTLTVGNLTLNSGSVLDYEFNGTANDLTSVTGALTLNTGSTVSVNLLQEGTANAFAAAGTYNLIRYGTGSVIDTMGLTVSNMLAGYSYSFNNDTADSLLQLSITATPVPEPATWVSALVGIGMIGYARCRRMQARA